MKTRIEVNEAGELCITVPEEIVQELMLNDGDIVEWYEHEGVVSLTFD